MEQAYDSDQALIDACRAGDARAWEQVLHRYERLVFSIPLNYGLAHDDAADVTQTTFTILLQSLDTLRPDSRLGPWLATVARRHTWRVLARRRQEAALPPDDFGEHVASLGLAAPDMLERWEVLHWLHEGLGQLDERCRALLMLLYFDAEEPSYADVAARLALPIGSIGPTRARCLERLKRVLDEHRS